MNTFSTASTRPRADAGVTNGVSVDRMNTLTASAALSTRRLTNAIAKLCVMPSTMVPMPKMRDRDEQRSAYTPVDRPQRERDGHDRRTNSRGRAQHAEPDRAHAQLLVGDRRQQRDCAAKQHREEIERDRTEQDRSAEDETQALERGVQARCVLMLTSADATPLHFDEKRGHGTGRREHRRRDERPRRRADVQEAGDHWRGDEGRLERG